MKSTIEDVLPIHRDLYYGGAWQTAKGGYTETFNPGTGASLGRAALANTDDVDAAVSSAAEAFKTWRNTKPEVRAAALRKIAQILRDNTAELGLLDAANCGNPVRDLVRDADYAANGLEYFAGLISELKGSTIPTAPDMLNMTVREPYGVCARIVAFNHPLLYLAWKMAAPLAAGNTVVFKAAPQSPLSAYRFMELIDGILPPGVVNVLTGGAECGAALTAHHDVPVVTLIGSVPTGRAIAAGAAKRLKHVLLELGGKNALIVYPDADLVRVVAGIVNGMNFGWCGQSCGSTSRVFLHDAVYDRVMSGLLGEVTRYRPGVPTMPDTTMGAIISQEQQAKIMSYISSGQSAGARLMYGGGIPADPELQAGYYIEPTIFGDVSANMAIAREEIFGPVLSILRWTDEDRMLQEANDVEYGLAGAVFTTNLATAHRAARTLDAGYIWINHAGPHLAAAPFGGHKQSGIGREESIDELYEFSQLKHISIAL